VAAQIRHYLFPLDVGCGAFRSTVPSGCARRKRSAAGSSSGGRAADPEADESLAALLTRRDQVRAKQTAPPRQPSPDLFEPEHPVCHPAGEKGCDPDSTRRPSATEPLSAATPADQRANTTSRLLEAKRRAQQRKDK